MKSIIVLTFVVMLCSPGVAQESLQELQTQRLRSKFKETPYSARVKVLDVKKKGDACLLRFRESDGR